MAADVPFIEPRRGPYQTIPAKYRKRYAPGDE